MFIILAGVEAGLSRSSTSHAGSWVTLSCDVRGRGRSLALRAGRVVAAVGEPGAGRATVLAQAQRRAQPRDRILSARTPAASDVEAWLSLWSPELGKPSTAVVVRRVDGLPAWAADGDAGSGDPGVVVVVMVAPRLVRPGLAPTSRNSHTFRTAVHEASSG